MQPQSAMRPPVPQQGLTDQDIAEICQETGYDEQRVRNDIARTGATSKEQLYPQFYSGAGIQPQGETVADGAIQGQPPATPPPAPMDSPTEEAAEPPQTAPQEAAEGEGLSPEGVAAMQMAMRHVGPTARRRREPPPMRSGTQG